MSILCLRIIPRPARRESRCWPARCSSARSPCMGAGRRTLPKRASSRWVCMTGLTNSAPFCRKTSTRWTRGRTSRRWRWPTACADAARRDCARCATSWSFRAPMIASRCSWAARRPTPNISGAVRPVTTTRPAGIAAAACPDRKAGSLRAELAAKFEPDDVEFLLENRARAMGAA